MNLARGGNGRDVTTGRKTWPLLTSSLPAVMRGRALPAVKRVRISAEDGRARTTDNGRRWCMCTPTSTCTSASLKKGRKQKTSIRFYMSKTPHHYSTQIVEGDFINLASLISGGICFEQEGPYIKNASRAHKHALPTHNTVQCSSAILRHMVHMMDYNLS